MDPTNEVSVNTKIKISGFKDGERLTTMPRLTSDKAAGFQAKLKLVISPIKKWKKSSANACKLFDMKFINRSALRKVRCTYSLI